jgi:hypothetical protein
MKPFPGTKRRNIGSGTATAHSVQHRLASFEQWESAIIRSRLGWLNSRGMRRSFRGALLRGREQPGLVFVLEPEALEVSENELVDDAHKAKEFKQGIL